MSPEISSDDCFADAPTLLDRFARQTTTPSEVLKAQEQRLARLEPSLRCYITYDPEGARAAARRADEAWRRGDGRALLGLSVGVKDLYDVRGLPTTGGSRAYGQEPAVEDASVVGRMRQAGAVITGKLNTEELAFGVISAPTQNPYKPGHISGGSSGGSAAALAAGLVQLSVGTDTAGSIRIPAALCGVVGLKPSQGLVPRKGVMPLSDTLDHAGPMARDVASLRLLFDVVAGPDRDDPLSLPATPPAPPAWDSLGVPWSWFADELDPAGMELFRTALGHLAAMGHEAEGLDWPAPEEFAGLQARIRAPETYVTHRDAVRDRPERFGPGIVRRIVAGRDSLGSDYVAAQRERVRLTRALERDLEGRRIGLVALPTTPVPAPAAGHTHVRLQTGREPTVRDALIRYTAPFNVTGWPALSLPLGLGRDGLPRAIQLVAQPFDDLRLMAVAAELARRLPPMQRPPLD